MTNNTVTLLLAILFVSGTMLSVPAYAADEESSGGGGSDEGTESESAPEPKPEQEPEPEPDAQIPENNNPPQPVEEEEKIPIRESSESESSLPTEQVEQKETQSINPCLLDPSDPTCPKPNENQDCPSGWAQNEDGNCFPLHPEGCPDGFHGHEDDETGRCIPNSTPCDPSYILVSGENDRKNCERKEFYCQTHPSDDKCKPFDDEDRDEHIFKFINNIKIIKKLNGAKSNDGDLGIAQTIVAINYQEGAGINCVFDDKENGQCETFTVTKDNNKEPLLQILPF